LGVVIDANVICKYSQSLISEETDPIIQLMDCIDAGPGISIDSGDKIFHQWRETCDRGVLDNWFAKGVQSGRIKVESESRDRKHAKHLQTSLGFPYRDRHEGTYVEVAAVTTEKVIITEDIDFWSPKEKKASMDRKKVIRESGIGSVAKYLKKEMDISVVTIQQAILQLDC
jgi:hypothetical protein